jgi:very-short-patch-repair endonuclease
VVEVDGMQHLQPDAMENDRERTRYFEAMDILVLRFSNQEVKQHLGAVCRKINETVKQRLDIMSRALEQDK